MTPAEAHQAVESGAVVLDLRPPRPFATEHLPGAITMQFNRADLADRAELMLPPQLRLVVHAEPEPIARAAVEILQGAGYAVLGHLAGGLKSWKEAGYATETLPLMNVDELKDRLGALTVIDAREPFEHRHAHIPDAVLLPPGDAWERAAEAPEGALAVVCGDQTRSAYVASVLCRHDKEAALVMGGMVDWLEREYPVERVAAQA
jgi:rhodanese-related sulfurtransferase